MADMDVVAREARRRELEIQDARMAGREEAHGELARALATLAGDLSTRRARAADELAAFRAGAGPGVTESFGPRTALDRLIEAERDQATAAVVDAVIATPTLAEADALAVWQAAVSAPFLRPAAMLKAYGKIAAQQGAPDDTWVSLATWVVAKGRAAALAALK